MLERLQACAAGCQARTLEKYIADNLPTVIDADFAPLEARIIDEDTYVQQGRDLEKAYGDAVLDLHPRQRSSRIPTWRSSAIRSRTSSRTSSWASITPTDMDGAPNPYFDDVEGDGIKDNRTTIREGYIRSAYHEADAKLALGTRLMGGNPTTVAGSDHGFGAQWYAVNARKVLFDAG